MTEETVEFKVIADAMAENVVKNYLEHGKGIKEVEKL